MRLKYEPASEPLHISDSTVHDALVVGAGAVGVSIRESVRGRYPLRHLLPFLRREFSI